MNAQAAITAAGLSIADRFHAGGMLSLDEFAAWAGICRRRVYLEIKADRLRIAKIGRRTVVRARDARDWQDALGPAEGR
jgi:hypothetical protein